MNTNNNAQYPVYISMILCMMHVSNSHTLDEVMLNVWSVIKFADTVTTYCWKDKSVTYKLYHCNLQLYSELCNVAINLYWSNLLYLFTKISHLSMILGVQKIVPCLDNSTEHGTFLFWDILNTTLDNYHIFITKIS